MSEYARDDFYGFDLPTSLSDWGDGKDSAAAADGKHDEPSPRSRPPGAIEEEPEEPLADEFFSGSPSPPPDVDDAEGDDFEDRNPSGSISPTGRAMMQACYGAVAGEDGDGSLDGDTGEFSFLDEESLATGGITHRSYAPSPSPPSSPEQRLGSRGATQTVVLPTGGEAHVSPPHGAMRKDDITATNDDGYDIPTVKRTPTAGNYYNDGAEPHRESPGANHQPQRALRFDAEDDEVYGAAHPVKLPQWSSPPQHTRSSDIAANQSKAAAMDHYPTEDEIHHHHSLASDVSPIHPGYSPAAASTTKPPRGLVGGSADNTAADGVEHLLAMMDTYKSSDGTSSALPQHKGSTQQRGATTMPKYIIPNASIREAAVQVDAEAAKQPTSATGDANQQPRVFSSVIERLKHDMEQLKKTPSTVGQRHQHLKLLQQYGSSRGEAPFEVPVASSKGSVGGGGGEKSVHTSSTIASNVLMAERERMLHGTLAAPSNASSRSSSGTAKPIFFQSDEHELRHGTATHRFRHRIARRLIRTPQVPTSLVLAVPMSSPDSPPRQAVPKLRYLPSTMSPRPGASTAIEAAPAPPLEVDQEAVRKGHRPPPAAMMQRLALYRQQKQREESMLLVGAYANNVLRPLTVSPTAHPRVLL